MFLVLIGKHAKTDQEYHRAASRFGFQPKDDGT